MVLTGIPLHGCKGGKIQAFKSIQMYYVILYNIMIYIVHIQALNVY